MFRNKYTPKKSHNKTVEKLCHKMQIYSLCKHLKYLLLHYFFFQTRKLNTAQPVKNLFRQMISQGGNVKHHVYRKKILITANIVNIFPLTKKKTEYEMEFSSSRGLLRLPVRIRDDIEGIQ